MVNPTIKHIAFAWLLSMTAWSACYGFEETQTITFDSIPDKTVGNADFLLTARASSGLPVTFEVVSGPASVSGALITLTGKGIVVVRARQHGNEHFAPAHADRLFVVNEPGCTALRIGGQIIDRCDKNGVLVFGRTYPVRSRATLESLERDLVLETYPDLPGELIHPKTQASGQMLEQYRVQHLEKAGNDYVRRLEFVMSDSLVERLEAFGVDVFGMVLAHEPALNTIWRNSIPGIQRVARIKRVVILSRQMYSAKGGGWRVVNNTDYSWWANDEFNGIPGDIPYDIDSRWAMDESWADIYPFFVTDSDDCEGKPGCRIDYGLLHELTHHLPVGDNYVYNMAQGHNLHIPQPDGRSMIYSWADLSFMGNDHMSSPIATTLTAPAAYFMQYYWKLNPMHAVVGQASAYPAVEVYGRHFFNNFTFVLRGLSSYGISGCNLMHEVDGGDGKMVLTQSTQYQHLTFTGDECVVTLNQQQQLESFPGRYIGLQKGQVVLPLYFPRNLLETLFWKEALSNSKVPDNYRFEVTLQPPIQEAFTYLASLPAQAGNIEMYPSMIKAYFYNDRHHGSSTHALLTANIDNLNNHYTVEFHESRFNLSMFPSVIKVKLLPGDTTSRRLQISGGEFGLDWFMEISGPASWLQVSQTSGFLESNKQVDLRLGFDAAALDNGVYSTTLRVTNSLSSQALNIPVQLEVASNPLSVYPNPATDVLHIESLSDIMAYMVIDCSGRVLVSHEHTTSASVRDVDLDVGDLSAGIYFLKCRLKDAEGVSPVKVVVLR